MNKLKMMVIQMKINFPNEKICFLMPNTVPINAHAFWLCTEIQINQHPTKCSFLKCLGFKVVQYHNKSRSQLGMLSRKF